VKPRRIAVVTVARSDYGYYLPILHRIRADPTLELCLIVSGMHLSSEFGLTIQAIEADGFDIAERVDMLLSSDKPEGIAKSMGVGIIGFSQAYARLKPDILLLLGDRFEMLAAGVAMLPFNIPIAHISGGDVTEGAVDDSIRHALTKMSHLHFVSTDVYRRRLIQMGEEDWRITVSGAVSLDNLQSIPSLTQTELEQNLNIPLYPAPLLVTFHPVTREYDETGNQVTELMAALEQANLPVIFTLPNADTNNSIIVRAINDYVSCHPNAYFVANLGTQRYFSLLKYALAMVGNSSSGIIEAGSFQLPVVNIGNRQKGRLKGKNVIDAPCEREAILKAIHQVITANFRQDISQLQNPYGDGEATNRIIQTLSQVDISTNFLSKPFQDVLFE